MKEASVVTKTATKTELNHRDWHITPSETTPNSFDLKTKKGNTLCTLAFPKDCNISLLNLIASAPELQDIAEMYHDYMLGKAEKSMVFNIVKEVLNRTKYQSCCLKTDAPLHH